MIKNKQGQYQGNINEKMTSRQNIFYWQTDRGVTPQEAGEIWSDRHRYFDDQEIIDSVNKELKEHKIISIKPLDPEEQTSLGNVNSVRIATLESGEEIIIRNHPKGIENGYFYVESLASKKAKEVGIPSYVTLAIHDIQNSEDHSFQVIEKLLGTALKIWLENNPKDEDKILEEVGKTLAKLHTVKVKGFGPFDNKKAKNGELQGVHNNYEDAILAGLDFNCEVLQKKELFTAEQVQAVKELFKNNELLNTDNPVLIHNDFADWNLLTDGEKITGVLDFDECVGGDAISDIACWSTFFEPARLSKMLKGYFQIAEKDEKFEKKFELLRLRYIISKMTLRIRRYNWEPTDFMKMMIKNGTQHLKESLKYFDI